MLKIALRDYFQEHTDYLNRMVAAYVIGYAITTDDLAFNPALKFAAGPDDTGVIVSWNTEGPENKHEANIGSGVLTPEPNVEKNPILLPHLAEQQRIVDRIESLFTKLDEDKVTITKEKADELGNYELKTGNIVMGRSAPVTEKENG